MTKKKSSHHLGSARKELRGGLVGMDDEMGMGEGG